MWAGRGGGAEGAVDDGWCGRCRRGEGGVSDGEVPRLVYWLMVVELFLVCG